MRTNRCLLFLSLILSFIALSGKAQTLSPVHFGIKGGGNFSSLSLSDTRLDSKFSGGYFAGAMVRVDLRKVYIQGDVLFAQKKSKIETNDGRTEDAKWKSIEVPLVIGYKIVDLSLLNVRVFGGGVYSYVMDDNISILNNVNNSYREFDKSNVGYQVGAGVDISRFTIDLRYEGGLNNLSKDFKSKPNSFSLSLGYFFI